MEHRAIHRQERKRIEEVRIYWELEDGALTPLQRVLSGETVSPPPIWLMRQAGRHLPEYNELRQKTGSFLSLVFAPKLAAEVTMQPIRRYDMDAAIVFSDILVIPLALGRRLDFVKGRGPVLEPIDEAGIVKLEVDKAANILQPVMKTLRIVRNQLPESKSLIGFCGAPWTVATYMVSGQGTEDRGPARIMAATKPESFAQMIEILAEVSAEYLIDQAKAGADTVQIFDSWAGILGEDEIRRWVIAPTKRMVERIRAASPETRIIGFPKGIGLMLEEFVDETGVDGIGIDWTVPLAYARDRLQPKAAVQGNLDPLRLMTGGESLDKRVDEILGTLSGGPFIFNLGHGLRPNTPVERVSALVERVRSNAA